MSADNKEPTPQEIVNQIRELEKKGIIKLDSDRKGAVEKIENGSISPSDPRVNGIGKLLSGLPFLGPGDTKMNVERALAEYLKSIKNP
ncbi:hypothetical protein I203_101603 [Kwoniella mangroviensis CBS 8507]|uniref:uncharacterized protein n=1 Tax=Kwoniella mangroviensis CBS 8507 TaxID=1296122 RepID=UPI00080CF4EE|nr:uncharacterized protein I203_05655 [Kwoniella mangroviensis CBS 8507]OCF65405.1 hypothetical protein I203_05655 [Kwoniella mangroviensis CBS 8507]